MQAKAHLKLQAVSLVSKCKVFPAFFGEKDLQAHKINPTWHRERKWESCDVTLWLLSAESHAPSQEWSIEIYKKWAFKCTYTLLQQDKYSTQEGKYSKTSEFTDECQTLCAGFDQNWKYSFPAVVSILYDQKWAMTQFRFNINHAILDINSCIKMSYSMNILYMI